MKIEIVTNEKQRKDAYQVRTIVFVEEQKVPVELEIDEHEEEATHFVVYDGEKPIGAGRFRSVDGYGKVERICILKEYRGRNVGKDLMIKIEEVAQQEGFKALKLNAQIQAETFYKNLGYVTYSDEFLDAGIPHVSMKKELN
ncbi:GNAT family N-acetyltransferase [Bacillus sp. FJAT-45350]|uniref:GNAT family N-acetyltransferase n=1 Tax=Bacillus sp. FJAT-45350 TaxID=2011014 RepID=UPI000BB71AA2|nr:GNAT family N-acetyltransferase [Bacillus sp. FJAT-45350]